MEKRDNKSRWKRNLEDRWKRILLELGLDKSVFKAEIINEKIISWSIKLTLLLTLYLILRFIFRSLARKPEVSGIIEEAYNQYWFEFIFWALSGTFIISSILRLWSLRKTSIRFSASILKVFFFGFFLYLAEKHLLKDFYFFKSKALNIDYLFLLSAPIIFEFIIRCRSILLPFQKNESIFLENKPIDSVDSDKTTRKDTIVKLAEELNKSHFDSAFSIGVVGNWGVGKTSFVKSLEEKLKKPSSIIIHFNPWLFVERESLIHNFINSLKAELRKFDSSFGAEFDIYLKSLIEAEKSLKSNFSEVFNGMLNKPGSARDEFDNVNKLIKRLGKRIIIFIDDFDRLDSQEVADVLKLIRNTGDFYNTIYISCYDKMYLLRALEKFNNWNLDTVLDKFIDFEIPLSPVPINQIREFIDVNFLNKPDIKLSESEKNLIKNNLETLQPFMQFRDVKKFLNSLIFDFKLYGQRLNPVDFFLFEILKVRYPFLPGFLWRNRGSFFTRTEGQQTMILSLSPRSVDSNNSSDLSDIFTYTLENQLREADRNEFERVFLGDQNINQIIKILEILFPKKQRYSSGRISALDSFEHFFYHTIPSSVLLETELLPLIENKEYTSHYFFSQSFDFRLVDYLRESLYRDSNELKSRFQQDGKDVFEFLLFLMEWSKGDPFILVFFKDAYETFNGIEDSGTHFSHLIRSETSSLSTLINRSTLMVRIIRGYIYQESTVDFISKEEAQKMNLMLFERYLDLTNDFDNNAFRIFYNQIRDIDSETKQGFLDSNAIARFKEFIQKFPEGYLDLNIRLATHPQNNFTFVFEPFALQVFESKDEFRKFILAAEYPKLKKDTLIQYLDQAKINDDRAIEFHLKLDQLKELWLNFKTAWAQLSKNVPKQVKYARYHDQFLFESQTPPKNLKIQNDDLRYTKLFSLDQPLVIYINPIDTTFWRFGFTFGNEVEITKFPGVENSRHTTPRFSDIHLNVGSLEGDKWKEPNTLKIGEYLDGKRGITNPSIFDKYNGQKVKLVLNRNGADSMMHKMEVFIEGMKNELPVISILYDLTSYKRFRLSAWCEHINYKLNVEIVSQESVLEEKPLN